jgi:heavy metal sensor kinase
VSYGAILLLVIGGFGGALYQHERRTMLRAVESDVRTRALAAASAVECEAEDAYVIDASGAFGPEYEQPNAGAPYLVVFRRDGGVVRASRNAPAGLAPDPLGPRAAGGRRAFAAEGPAGTRVVAGRPTGHEERELQELAWAILGTGTAAFGLALLAGWWLVRRLLLPIDRISASAARISASNLSERIDLGRTESELGRLAATLNEAFGRIEAAVARQARFTADASHELRTPLAVIQASAEWALRKPRDAEAYREALTSCRDAAHRVGELVDHLLTLARADASALVQERRPVDLATIVGDVVRDLRPLARERGLDVSLESSPAPTLGDERQLGSLVGVLLTNAIVHGDGGGRVEVETGVASGEAFVSVADHGPGIPRDELARVFERFYRVDRARSCRAGGTGLGLSIADEIARAHGGRIEARSVEGEGTTFVLRLAAQAGAP